MSLRVNKKKCSISYISKKQGVSYDGIKTVDINSTSSMTYNDIKSTSIMTHTDIKSTSIKTYTDIKSTSIMTYIDINSTVL